MKKTVLYERHIAHHAKMVEYAGFDMPVEYVGLTEEHLAVRHHCGLFDVSHMGEIFITGPEAKRFVNYLITGLVRDPMRMTYALMLYPHGGIVDDLMAYYFSDDRVLLIVNASNIDKDDAWIREQAVGFDVVVDNASDRYGQLALQGVDAVKIMQPLTHYPLDTMKMFDFTMMDVIGRSFIVSRSGYTGEDGFEIYGAPEDILALFDAFDEKNVMLCGLGCRDTLRFEANLPLYGHEIGPDINPLEATLKFALDFSKDFIGKEALLQCEANGLQRKVVALELLERGIARAGYEVLANNEVIGSITTGYMLPGSQSSLALAMVKAGYWDIGTKVNVQIRKNTVQAIVRNKKFMNKKYIK